MAAIPTNDHGCGIGFQCGAADGLTNPVGNTPVQGLTHNAPDVIGPENIFAHINLRFWLRTVLSPVLVRVKTHIFQIDLRHGTRFGFGLGLGFLEQIGPGLRLRWPKRFCCLLFALRGHVLCNCLQHGGVFLELTQGSSQPHAPDAPERQQQSAQDKQGEAHTRGHPCCLLTHRQDDTEKRAGHVEFVR